MWNRPSITSTEVDLWLTNGKRWHRVEVKRPEEATWTNLSDTAGGDWTLGISYRGDNPDQPASQFTVTFLKHADADSLSPGIESALNTDAATEFRPLIHPGRHIRIWEAVTDGSTPTYPDDYHLWLQGEIEDVDWPGNAVSALCYTLDKRVLDTQIEEVREEGGEIAIEDVFEALLFRWFDPATTDYFRTVGDPAANLKNAKPEIGSLGDFLFSNAKRLGWDLRYLYNDAEGEFWLTLYNPPRDKTTPDLELSTSDVFEVAGLQQSRRHVRNVLRLNYEDRETDPSTPARRDATFIDQPSIDEYGRRAIMLTEAQGSPVDGPTNAAIFGPSVISDLRSPKITARKRIPFFPFVELHDLIAFQADDDHFDYDTQFAVVGVEHEVSGEDAFTVLDLHEGAPVGQVIDWIIRGEVPFVPPADYYSLREFDFHDEDPLGRTYTWQNAPGTTEIWAATATHADPITESAVEALKNAVTPRGLITELLVPWPPEGSRTIGRIEVRYATADGMAIGEVGKIDVPGTDAPLAFEPVFTTSSNGLQETLTLTIRDPRDVTGTPTISLDGATAVAMTDAGAGVWTHTYNLDAKHNVKVQVFVPRTDGQPTIVLGPWEADVDLTAEMDNATVSEDDEGTATVVAQGDTDSVTGASKARHSPDESSWTTMTVDANRRATFTVTQTTAELIRYVQFQNSNGDWGPSGVVKIPAYLGSVERFHRFMATEYVDDDATWDNPGGYITAAGAFDASAYKGIRFPKGITLTTLRVHGYKAGTGSGSGVDKVIAILRRIPDNGGLFSTLASAALPNGSTGWLTDDDTLSETVGDDGYELELSVGCATAAGSAKMEWIEIGYLGSWR